MNTLKSPNFLAPLASVTLVGAIALSGCGSPAPSETAPNATPTTISGALQQGLAAIRMEGCKSTNQIYYAAHGVEYDSDCDSVPNPFDRLPNVNDFGDSNSNGIPNGLEAYMPTQNVRLNPFGDDDRDGAPNATDRMPGLNDFADLNGNRLPDGVEPAQTTTYYTVDQMKADPNFVNAVRQNAQQLEIATKFYGPDAFTFTHYNLDINPTYNELLDETDDRVADPWGTEAETAPSPWEEQSGTEPDPEDPVEPQDPEDPWEPQDSQDPQPQNELPEQEEDLPQNREAAQDPGRAYEADNRDSDPVPDPFENSQPKPYQSQEPEWLNKDKDGDGILGRHDPDPNAPMGSNDLRDPFYYDETDARANNYDVFKDDYQEELLGRED